MPRVVYSRRAISDLDGIFEFIATDNPVRARSFVRDIRAKLAILRQYPAAGPVRGDLGHGLRVLPLPNRVIVAYVIRTADVEIMGVFYAGQDHETILRNRTDE